MIGKSNIADCNENCKYEGLYETYKSKRTIASTP